MSESDNIEEAGKLASKYSSRSARQKDRVIEVISAIMLGIVAIATAWSGYQAARWGGEQSTRYSQAGALRTEAVRANNETLIAIVVDANLFFQWINAQADANEDLADYYSSGFRNEFKPAYDAWLATDPFNSPEAPGSPFAMPEYTEQSLNESSALEQQAGEAFEEGQTANDQADAYVLTTVILASVLFFVGIATGFDWFPVQVAVIVTGFVLLIWGLSRLAIYPAI
jgi:hypothetical protein